MSSERKPPGPPPDDFSETAPNIKLPESADPTQQADWNKTNYNMPKQPPPDEWGRTVTNIKPIETGGADFDKTFVPGAQRPSVPEWGMTEAKVDLSNTDFGNPEPGSRQSEEAFGKTTPYFSLPEAERAKYQNIPPTPSEKAQQDEQEARAKGGVPIWAWVGCGLVTLFSFMVIVLFGVWWFYSGGSGFEATVRGAPPGSEVRVDNAAVGVTSEDGSIRLINLRAGEREIKIIHPNYTCETKRVTGRDGVNPEPVIARCQPVLAKQSDDCSNILLGEEDKAERCYYAALTALPDPFTTEDLVRALNILVINFASGSYEVPGVRLAALQKGAEYIKKLPPEVILEVGGHTDNQGGDALNQTLSENRANAVKTKLVGFGVRGETLQTRGYGASKPKPGADNGTEQGRFYNRRIEYSIVRK